MSTKRPGFTPVAVLATALGNGQRASEDRIIRFSQRVLDSLGFYMN
jgi:hypothetical protein